MDNDPDKGGYDHINFGDQMKYIHSMNMARIKAEFTNEKGVLLNAIHSESLTRNIIFSLDMLN